MSVTEKELQSINQTLTDINTQVSLINDISVSYGTQINEKVSKVFGKGLSTSDYEPSEKNKVANLPENTNNELEAINNTFTRMTKNLSVNNGRDIVNAGTVNYGADIANFVGQGLYPNNSVENNNFRALVIHNYVDSDCLLIDNVGDRPSIFIRNARNAARRIDKDSTYIGKGKFIQFQQGVMNDDGVTHKFVTMFDMDNLGNMYWRNTESDVQPVKFQTVSSSMVSKYQFKFSSYYETNYLMQLEYANNKAALNISRDSIGRTQFASPNGGLRFSASSGNIFIEALASGQGLMLSAPGGVSIRRDSVNYLVAHMASLGQDAPDSQTATGSRGQMHCTESGLYICDYDNHWVRFTPTSW